MQLATTAGAARPRYFPTRLFVGAVVIVCAALALSAIHSYRSMIELRELYLEGRAREISGTLTERLRGPDRLDPSAWRQPMSEATASGDYPWLRYLALLSEGGQPVVSSGQSSDSLYLYETAVRAPRWGWQGGRWGGSGPRQQPQAGQPTLFTLRVGVDRASADFISRRAYIHLAISGLAILTLSVLAYLFARTFRNYLELQAQEESQRRLAALGRLAATLAHEIRNPLGAIKGLTQVAQERLPRDHDTQELMTTVVTEAERLERLVNDLLAFARPRSAATVTLDIRPLLAEVAQQLRCQTEALRIVLKLPVSASATLVLADPDGLRQVFLNVFLNAVEATPPDSTIEVLIKSSNQTHVIEICDQGTGIGNRDPEELFQPFVTTKTRGTGLGLAVSRQIVERLAGTIELHNRQPTGTVCRVVLPAQSASTAQAEGIVTSAGG
jgi:signal transduction histidine kinase